MEDLCARAQEALMNCVSGDMTPDLRAHVAGCADCDDVRKLSSFFGGRRQEPASVRSAFEPGQKLLHYELCEILGEGGQGIVFRANETEGAESVVALKIVRSNPSSAKEARIKRVNHPNVVRVNHTAVHAGFRIIEMEFVERGTLAQRLDAAPPLSREQATAIYRGVLDGIEAVHDAGLLHLDLKPLNILLRKGDKPVVTDFGMSVRAGSSVLGGTRGWTAPEVERGEKADVRADVYSLGALLGTLMPSPTPAMLEVIARAEASRPEQRHPSVKSLREAFEAALQQTADAPLATTPVNHEPRVMAKPVPAPSIKRRSIAVGIVLAVIVTMALANVGSAGRGAPSLMNGASSAQPSANAAANAGETPPATATGSTVNTASPANTTAAAVTPQPKKVSPRASASAQPPPHIDHPGLL